MANLSLTTVESSNLPASQKSAIRRFYENMGGARTMARAKTHALAAGHGVRQAGESVVVGGALGAAHVYLPNGLDAKVGNTKVPLDAVVGGLALVGGIALEHEGVGVDLRNAAASALSVFAFRKAFGMLAKSRVPGGSFAGDDSYEYSGATGATGDVGEDPIIAAARAL